MSEHMIRFRGGWEWHDLEEGAAAPRRVTLPLTWPPDRRSLVRLVRSFHAPRLELGRETLALQMEAVEGLKSVWLNGREIARPIPGTSKLNLLLDVPLPARNLLVLEVEPSLPSELHQADSLWGTIALVIRSHADDPLEGLRDAASQP
jgi:hypothetical protein